MVGLWILDNGLCVSYDLPVSSDRLDARGLSVLLILTILWGLNYVAVKVSNEGLSPVFTTFIRSCIASCCGILLCLVLRQSIFHRGILFLHGLMVGVLFGCEFVCLYLGLLYTDASRAVILVYLSPFVVAVLAHIWLKERLTVTKVAGLVLAFLGLWLVFAGRPRTYTARMLIGDVLEIAAAVLWGLTTVYIKRFLAEVVHPINTFIYQLLFSIPIMFAFAWMLEPRWVTHLSALVVGSVLFQSVVVAFLSYLAWFKLIHTYPVARLSSFTFLTPIFGVLFGVVLLGEEANFWLLLSLLFVCTGIYLINATSPLSFLRRV